MKFERFWCCAVVLAMVFGCTALGSAQELVSGQARVTQSTEFVAPAARVVANDLPQVTAQQTAIHAVPSPQVRGAGCKRLFRGMDQASQHAGDRLSQEPCGLDESARRNIRIRSARAIRLRYLPFRDYRE